MFKRKNIKPKSGEGDENDRNSGSMFYISSSQEEDVNEAPRSLPKDDSYLLTESAKKEILKEIFKVPDNPKFELKSQLKNPQSILEEYIPELLKVLEWSLLYLLGCLGLSYAWIIVVGLLYFSRNLNRRAEKREKEPRHEKEILKSHLEYLPSWVSFPDVERVEWINIIIKKVWPNIGSIAQQIAKRLVEPKIKEILNRLRLEELSNFKLKGVDLGSIPARVGGIRVYERNTGRDEIIMDIELIYEGDPTVTFTVQNFGCEINQVSFRGTARLTIKPLLDSMPLLGGFEIYFLQMPTYEYNLGKMANFGEIPGISNIIKSVLDNIIRRGFVWPNRFSFYFPIESVETLRSQTFAMPSPQGVLQVLVSRGKHLVKKDKHLIGGKSDPYVVLSIGEKKISFKDRYVESTVDPEWFYAADFPVEEVAGLNLKLEVYDYDAGSEDDFLGRTSLPVESVLDGPIRDRWIRLDDIKHGEVQVSLSWSPAVPASLSGVSSTYVVAFNVDQCRHLNSGKSGAPYAKVEVSLSSPASETLSTTPRRESKKWIPSTRYEAYTTKARGPSEDPIFREGHFFLSRNPALDSMAIQVVDHRSGLVLGSACIQIQYIISLPDKEFSRMEWKLRNSLNPDSSIVLSAKLYSF